MIGKTISHYRILEKLGEGGMGVVYKAEDTILQRTVALKFLPSELVGSSEWKERFIREAQAASALDHPSICTVHEIEEAENQTFIVMSYIDGRSVSEKIESGPVDVEEAVDIAIQVAEGLQEAHDKGIIHCDIKSANIMVDDSGRVRITDFGLAKLTGKKRITKRAVIMGTAAYLSPEQAHGDAILSHQTDIWSLGVVLYEMVTGRLPFDAATEAALIHKIIYEDSERIMSLRSDVPAALEQIVEKMMQKDPRDRYEDMRAVAKDLSTMGSTSPVTWRRSSRSIAVLPFADMSPQKDQEYFCDGLAEEIINALSQIGDLRVIARTSAFSFKNKHLDIYEIGRKLKVQNVLEGSVRKAGNRLRITVQLVDTAGGHHVWSERYDREMEDIFAIQDEITSAIVDNLKPMLLGDEKARLAGRQTVDLEAYNLYLRGRYFWNKRTGEGLRKSIEYYSRAIGKCPDYALAYAGLADSYTSLPVWTTLPGREFCPKAKEAALQALKIDDTLAEAHTSLAFLKASFDYDWEVSEQEFKRAIELNPGYATAHTWHALCLLWMSRPEEALKEIRYAYELDPFSLVTNEYTGLIHYYSGRYDEAIDALHRTIEMDPDFIYAHGLLGLSYLEKSMYDEAITEIQAEVSVSERLIPSVKCWLGHAYARAGKSDEARTILDALLEQSKHTNVSTYFLANLCFALGEHDHGFTLLDKAYEDRDFFLVFLKVDPLSEPIRSAPRYKAMLKKIGLDT